MVCFKLFSVFVVNEHIDKRNRRVFHAVYDTIDLRDNVVVENLKDDRYNKTKYGC